MSRIDKDEKQLQDKRIFELWLSCHTDKAIGEFEELPEETVLSRRKNILENGNLAKLKENDITHATDFEIPLYNIWKKKNTSNTVRYFGYTEQTKLLVRNADT